MTPEELRQRTTDFAAEVVKFCRQLRTQPEARGIAEQLSDSATSVAANYRSVTRARSRREFIAKLAVAVEEADETLGWLEILVRSGTRAAIPMRGAVGGGTRACGDPFRITEDRRAKAPRERR